MKEKIFNALKQAYPQLGLSDEILRHHANMLDAAIGVTDENLATVIGAQKDYLQGLQSENDKRATSAIAKAKAAAESDKQNAIDEAVKAAVAAERKRVAEEAEKKAKEAEEKRKAEEQAKEEPEFMKKFREELAEKDKAFAEREASLSKKIEDLLKANETQTKTLSDLQKENETMKAEKAKAARAELIHSTAKELGIPDWRINEGFVIADDADDAVIKEKLSTVANNLKVNTMQGNGGLILDDKKVTQEEAAAIVEKMMK